MAIYALKIPEAKTIDVYFHGYNRAPGSLEYAISATRTPNTAI
jgi:hypothetical protein